MAPQEAEIQALMGSLVVVVAVKTVIDGPTPKGPTPNGPKKTREKVTIQTTKRKTMLGIALQLQQKKTTTIIVNKQLNKQTNVSNSVAARARTTTTTTTTKLKTNKTTEKRTNQHKLRH